MQTILYLCSHLSACHQHCWQNSLVGQGTEVGLLGTNQLIRMLATKWAHSGINQDCMAS